MVAAAASWPACHDVEPSAVEDPPCREGCTQNLSRAQTSFRWCDVIVRTGGASCGVVLGFFTMFQNVEVRRPKPLSN
ncbi:hypothetical protein TNCV_2095531 [Trichonephila clavipes]|nr:hypothetical protein TNCV_2095531 [Trichonephila clavipes]